MALVQSSSPFFGASKSSRTAQMRSRRLNAVRICQTLVDLSLGPLGRPPLHARRSACSSHRAEWKQHINPRHIISDLHIWYVPTAEEKLKPDFKLGILAPVVRKAGIEVTSLPSGTIGKKFVFRTVPGNPKALAYRFLLCSCQPCRERKWLDCEREHECGSWVEAPLEKTLSSTQVSVTRNAIRSRASAGRRAVAQAAPRGRDIVLEAAPEYDDHM